MSYCPPFFFNTQQLSQSQQTSPGQQQSQQPPTLVQTSASVASYQPPLPAVAPWHQPPQQTVYWSDIGTRYVYDNANQTSVSANPTAISVNPMSHLSMTDSLQTTPNRHSWKCVFVCHLYSAADGFCRYFIVYSGFKICAS